MRRSRGADSDRCLHQSLRSRLSTRPQTPKARSGQGRIDVASAAANGDGAETGWPVLRARVPQCVRCDSRLL